MFGCADRRNVKSFGDLPPEQAALKGVMERLQGMSRQIAKADHQLAEMNETVDKAMEVAAQHTDEIMGHIDYVKGSIQSAQSSIEARIVAIESRLNLVEGCIDNSRMKNLKELDEVSASLSEKLNMETQKLGSSMQDIVRRLGEAEVACREAHELEDRLDYIEVINRQAIVTLSKVTERQDSMNGTHRGLSAWCTSVDQQAGELRRKLLSELSLACEPHVESDACLEARLPTDRTMVDMDLIPSEANTASSACGGLSAAKVPEDLSRGRRWRRQGTKNRVHSCPSNAFTHWCAELPCVASVPAFPVEVASGRSTSRPHEGSQVHQRAT